MSLSTDHATGTVASGDVELFYRRFGRTGATPILLLHGANYYDSYDWIELAGGLASDREVVAFDARGYGSSTWSPDADYSLDAQLADIDAVCEHLGWTRVVLVGASRGGSFALRYAARAGSRAAAVVLVDYCPGRTAGGAAATAGATPAVFATLEEALASTTRDPHELERATGRRRLEAIFAPVDGGYALAVRDPASRHDRPRAPADGASAYVPSDLWSELEQLRLPVLAVRATRSRAYDEPSLERIRRLSHVTTAEVESGHDVVAIAPAALLAALEQFLAANQAQIGVRQ